MTTAIRLLGPPELMHGTDVVKIKGRKPWGLLAYLLLTQRPVNRGEVTSALFTEADDPFRVLRWNLTELRRGLRMPSALRAHDLQLDLPSGTRLDVDILSSGRWSEAITLPTLGRDLLEGMTFTSAPGFEAWLLNQRRRFQAITASVLREAASSLLAADESERAVDVAVRLVGLDPLNEPAQALLIRAYVSAGDTASASRQFAACVQLLRDELAVEPGDEIYDAIRTDRLPRRWRPTGEPAARAQLEAGQAAIRGGALEAGLDCLRRAATEAHSCGSLALEADALFEIGATIAHRVSNKGHDEAATVLHSVIDLAQRLGDDALEGRACYELAWINFLEAQYERSNVWVVRAVAATTDPSVRAAAGYVRGKGLMEMGRYSDALATLREALGPAEASGEPIRMAWVLAALGRALMLTASTDEALRHLNRAVDLIRTHALTWYAPCAEAYLGELYRMLGMSGRARGVLDHAIAIARENRDVTGEALAVRGRALLQAQEGDVEGGLTALREVLGRLADEPEYAWAEAWGLDALCTILVDHQVTEAARSVTRLEEVTGRAGMRELLTHAYLYRHRLGDPDALEAAVVLAHDIDNPSLRRRLAAASSTHVA